MPCSWRRFWSAALHSIRFQTSRPLVFFLFALVGNKCSQNPSKFHFTWKKLSSVTRHSPKFTTHQNSFWGMRNESSFPILVPTTQMSQIPTPPAWHIVLHSLSYWVALHECQQLWMDVSRVSVHSRCISSDKLVLTQVFFQDKGGLGGDRESERNSVLVALDSLTKTFKGCILQPNVFCYISPTRLDQKFEASIQIVAFLPFCFAHRQAMSSQTSNCDLFPFLF